jgi:hypothetical protein
VSKKEAWRSAAGVEEFSITNTAGAVKLAALSALGLQVGSFDMVSWSYSGGTTTTVFWDGEAAAAGLTLYVDSAGEITFATPATVTSLVRGVAQDASYRDSWGASGWSASEIKTHKRATYVDDGVWTDLTDGTTALIPCASGITKRVEVRLVAASVTTGETAGTFSRSINFACTVQNDGTVTIPDDPGVTPVGDVMAGAQLDAQFVVVAGTGVKVQINCPVVASTTHAGRVEAYVTTYALTR